MKVLSKKNTRLLLIVFVLLLLEAGSLISQKPSYRAATYLVTRVIDGDTIEIEGGHKIRYIGIDTPESVAPNTPVECFGKESTQKNKELVEGKYIKFEKDVSETDRYGRLLRYVWVDGVFVNDELVREGYANAISYPPDIKYQEQLRAAEAEARNTQRGLWSSCDYKTPESTET